ncbi:MAG: hypothetical protein IIU08_10605 [Clostridia bacterium]|nr:hypothetical protein [Clostridia bacterium]
MSEITVYTPNEVRRGLCTDPLCAHDGSDGICPDDTRAMVRSVATDGEKLYLSLLLDPETAGKKPGSGAVKQIWSLDRDGSDFRLLCSRSSDGRNFSALEAGDGYLWFPERRIDEDAPEGEAEYTVLMRLPVEGGEPEEALDEKFLHGLSYAVAPDGSRVAVISFAEADPDNLYTSAGQRIEITELKTGEKTVIPPPADDVLLSRLHYALGELWLEAERGGERTYVRDSGEKVTETAVTMVLYRLNRETERFEEVTSAASGSYFFGPDAVWYVRAESEYLATKPMPTGRGSEKRDYDFFITKNLVISCVKDGDITDRAPGEGIEPGQALTLLAAADGVLYGTLCDEQKVYDTGETVNRVVALDPETLDVICDLGELYG